MDRTHELILLAQNGDKDATEMLVKENTGLIWSIVKKFTNRGYEPEDLFQIGSIGLLKCINKFDMNYDVKFSTYAVPMIMGEIKRFLRDDGMIKVSRPLKELANKAKYVEESMTARNGKPPTVTELAGEMGINVDDLIMAQESNMDVESLYSTVYQGDSNPVYLIDKLQMATDNEGNIIDILALRQILNKLSSKERQIIYLRYFMDKTQIEIAKEIGVSQVQVSRLEKKVLQTIKKQFV